jgi:hypothetical protein
MKLHILVVDPSDSSMGWDGGYGFRHEADMGVVTSVLLRNLD